MVDHRIHQILRGITSVFIYQRHCSFTFANLLGCITTESYRRKPSNLCEKLRYILGDESSIESLVEVYTITFADNLLDLLQAVVACEDVVVHKDEIRAPINGNFLYISIRSYSTLLLRNNTPSALIRATASEETISDLLVEVWID